MENRKKIHRFICDFDERDGRVTVTAPEAVHQMRRVLKLAPGEMIGLCRGDGRELRVRLSSLDSRAVCGEAVETADAPSARRRVTLYAAVLKRENFEWVAAKSTEIGVAAVVPLITARTVKTDLRPERLGRIIRESAEQCGRCDLPVLGSPTPFSAALSAAAVSQHPVPNSFFLDTAGGPMLPLGEEATEPINIFIGPEGGWSPDELSSATLAGCIPASLGGLTLRAETAAVVAAHWACWT